MGNRDGCCPYPDVWPQRELVPTGIPFGICQIAGRRISKTQFRTNCAGLGYLTWGQSDSDFWRSAYLSWISCTKWPGRGSCAIARSEEHTSELQSRENLVCRLLLEKKKKK